MCMIDTREVDATTGLATITCNFFKPPKGSRIIGGTLWAEAMVPAAHCPLAPAQLPMPVPLRPLPCRSPA